MDYVYHIQLLSLSCYFDTLYEGMDSIAHTKGVETAWLYRVSVILIKYPVMGMRRPMVS